MVYRNATARSCGRFEKFIIGSANPDIILLGSSVFLTPSDLYDLKSANAKRMGLIQLQKFLNNYVTPVSFVRCLNKHGLSNVSAIDLCMSAAVIADDDLIIKQCLIYRKRPRLVIYGINPRDFAFHLSKTWITPAFKDIPLLPFACPRWLRLCLVELRPSSILRNLDTERSYFRQMILLPSNLVQQTNAHFAFLLSPFTKQKYNDIPVSALGKLLEPNKDKIDLTGLDCCFAPLDREFVNNQFIALENSANLLREKDIKLLIVEIPFCPGAQERIPQALRNEYEQRMQSICKEYGAIRYQPESEQQFSTEDYFDWVHMNAIGAAKLFDGLSNFISQRRSQLLPGV